MKIYTRTGDSGTTALYGGKRVPKHALRIEAYGTVDELNAGIGLLVALLDEESLVAELRTIQSRLFDIGAHLAAVPDKKLQLPELGPDLATDLESAIDRHLDALPALKHFVLPGNDQPDAQAHICRTVCRRAERWVSALSESEVVDSKILIYLNRLSDYFFALSRALTFASNREETKWIPVKKIKNSPE